MDIVQTIQTKRAEIVRLAARYGARHVRLIGSVARGEAGPGSDVDFLVEFEPGRTLLDHAALMQDLEALLGCTVDVASERGLRDRIRARVLAEAIPL
ncbi:MAG: nucleotidyltransferase family protein [bacterium]|nr:nucleotidyltransferase family protein [bacterium]